MTDQPISFDIDKLIQDLQSAIVYNRRDAAKKLGELNESNERIIDALITARETDRDLDTRNAASASLLASAHQTFMQQHPNIVETIIKKAQESAHKLKQIPVSLMSWNEIWIMALTKPSLETFERISLDPDATGRRARKWLFVSCFIYAIIALLVQILRALNEMGRPGAFFQVIFSSAGLQFLISAVIVAAIGVVVIMIATGISHIIAKVLKGQGTYSRFLYTCAAYLAPIIITIAILIPIPYIQLLILPIAVYSIVLNVLSLKVVYQLGWAKSIVSSIAGQLALLGIFAVVILGSISLATTVS